MPEEHPVPFPVILVVPKIPRREYRERSIPNDQQEAARLIAGGIRTLLTSRMRTSERGCKSHTGISKHSPSVSEDESAHTTYANIPVEDRGVPSLDLRCFLT